MYTQSFNVPDGAGQQPAALTPVKPVPRTEPAELMARFDACIVP